MVKNGKENLKIYKKASRYYLRAYFIYYNHSKHHFKHKALNLSVTLNYIENDTYSMKKMALILNCFRNELHKIICF